MINWVALIPVAAVRTADAQTEWPWLDFPPAFGARATPVLRDPDDLLDEVGDSQQDGDAHANVPAWGLRRFSSHQEQAQ